MGRRRKTDNEINSDANLFDKNRLRECIEDAKYTQIAFGKAVGVSRVTVFKWLDKLKDDVPGEKYLDKIASVLGIEKDYLFGGKYKTREQKKAAFFGPYEDLKKLSNDMVEKWLQINGYIHVYTMIWEEHDISDENDQLFLSEGTVLMRPGTKNQTIKLLRIINGIINDDGSKEIEGYIYSKDPERIEAPLRMYYEDPSIPKAILDGEIVIKDLDDLQFLAKELLDFLELRFEQISEKNCRHLPGIGPGGRQYLKAVQGYTDSVSK